VKIALEQMMSDWHNWSINVDQCRQKHIGPPPPLQRRIAYLEAHRWVAHTKSLAPLLARIKLLLRRLASSAPRKPL
jgi:hypothetical protein